MISFSITKNIAIVNGNVIRAITEKGSSIYKRFPVFRKDNIEGGFLFFPNSSSIEMTSSYKGKTILFSLKNTPLVEEWFLREDGFLIANLTPLTKGKGAIIEKNFTIFWKKESLLAYIGAFKKVNEKPPITKKEKTNYPTLIYEKQPIEMEKFIDVFIDHII